MFLLLFQFVRKAARRATIFNPEKFVSVVELAFFFCWLKQNKFNNELKDEFLESQADYELYRSTLFEEM